MRKQNEDSVYWHTCTMEKACFALLDPASSQSTPASVAAFQTCSLDKSVKGCLAHCEEELGSQRNSSPAAVDDDSDEDDFAREMREHFNDCPDQLASPLHELELLSTMPVDRSSWGSRM